MLSIQNSNDFFAQVVAGNVLNYSALRIEGTNPDAVAGTEDLNVACGVSAGDGAITTITRPTSAVAMYISSSSTSDTTQYATVTGLNASYDVVSARILLVGRTKTAVGASFMRINSVALSATCAGNVFVYQDDTVSSGVPAHAAKVMAVVPIGALVADQGFYTVPNGYNAYVYMINYNSYGAATGTLLTAVTLSTTYSGTTVSYTVGRYTDPGSGQLQFTAKPIKCVAGTDIKLTSTLAATGTGQVINAAMEIILESTTSITTYTDAWTKAVYDDYLSDNSRTLASTQLYLIGLDTVPTSIPTQFILENLLTPGITGTTAYKVAATTEIAFEVAYFTSGRLIITTKDAIFCVWKCVDSGGYTKYVIAPSNPIIPLDPRVKKITFQA